MKLLFFIFILSTQAFAQDLRSVRVETFFRETAAEVLASLPTQQQTSLSMALSRGSVEVVEKELIDNGGSLVDAIGVRGKVTLSLERWISFIRENRDVRLLILHEVLRMDGQNDDGYVISRRLLPQTNTSISMRSYCDLRVAQTTTKEIRRDMTGIGYAPMARNGTFMMGPGMDNSSQDKAMDAAINDIKERCEQAGYESYGHGSGQLSVEQKNSNGRRTAQYKITLNGVCAKSQPVQRPAAEQKAEGCRKIAVCRDLIHDNVIAPLDAKDSSAMDSMERKWKCL